VWVRDSLMAALFALDAKNVVSEAVSFALSLSLRICPLISLEPRNTDFPRLVTPYLGFRRTPPQCLRRLVAHQHDRLAA